MDPIIWMAIGASGLGAVILARLAAKHSLGWARAQLKLRADQAEAAFKAKVSAAIGDLAPRITSLENELRVKFQSDVEKLNDDMAAVKAKVGA